MYQSDAPEALKPYLFHGIDLRWSKGTDEALGECPWCDTVGKFSVNLKTGKWQCFRCDERGNAVTFVRKLWEISYERTKTQDYQELASNRKLLYDDTLMQWQLARSFMGVNWLVPGYGASGHMNTLYQYVNTGERFLLMPTPTLKHQLLGMCQYNKSKSTIYFCEGIWDALALWETLGSGKLQDDGTIAPTSNRDASLLGDANVLATPTCKTFYESWLPLFAGKHVNLMGQNDHPGKHPKSGKPLAPASYMGMKRIAQLLLGSQEPPADIQLLNWGDKGFDDNLPHGYDLRDAITS